MVERETDSGVLMFLKVIDSNKVKILVEEKDIADTGLNFENLDYNDDASRSFILKLLEETYIQTGINFFESKILVEAVPGISNSFYLIITRTSSDQDLSVNFDKTVKADRDMYLFELKNFENIYDIARLLNGSLHSENSKLFKYRGKFYLGIWFAPETVENDDFYMIVKNISEYADKCKWRIINEALLCEWGELISDDPMAKL